MFKVYLQIIIIAFLFTSLSFSAESKEKRQIAHVSDIVTKEDIHSFVRVKANEILNEKNNKRKVELYRELYKISESEFERYNKDLAVLYSRLDEKELDKSERQKILDQIHGISDFSAMWGDLSVAFEYTENILEKKEGACGVNYKSDFIRSYVRTEPDGSELNLAAQIVLKLAEDFCGGIAE